MNKKQYIKPLVIKTDLDYTISLVMQSDISPLDPPGRTDSKGTEEPFSSPFGDKPFG